MPAKNERKPEHTVTMESKIRARIQQLERERDNFVQQANQQVAGYNGAIVELQRLLNSEKKDAIETDSEHKENEDNSDHTTEVR